jgi:adenosine deaminase
MRPVIENVDPQYTNDRLSRQTHLHNTPQRFILGQFHTSKQAGRMISIRKTFVPLTASVLLTAALAAQSSLTPAEARTERAFAAAKRSGAPELYAFLKPFPKGADLHMHLSGAIYAETFLTEAVKQDLCVDPAQLELAAPPCKKPLIPASATLSDQPLYDKLIDAFSMRSYVPFSGWSGHDQFFATFSRWGALEKSVAGEWLDEVATRAASQNEQYLEIMQTPSFGNAATLGYKIGWPTSATTSVDTATLSTLRDKLLAAGLREEVSTDSKQLADAQTERNRIEHCHPEGPLAYHLVQHGCTVKIHWLYQILRGFPPQQVFAQTLLGFEVASADPDVVGLNFVMPEDGRISMQDYHLQMQMLDYLHSVYPRVHITLHAGELAQGMVAPDGLTFHIREAINLGHAERIGHGVDVLYEDHPNDLLKEMAAKHVMVEVNLTSNDGILGIKGTDHPLAAYRAAHVPWALSTDDEGVSRIDLTHEYVRGALEQNLTYADLKQSARTALEHAFLHGASLYSHPDDFTHRITACAAPITDASEPTFTCQAFLTANEKASEQYELERRFAIFEAAQH